jgi:hypothetical protein
MIIVQRKRPSGPPSVVTSAFFVNSTPDTTTDTYSFDSGSTGGNRALYVALFIMTNTTGGGPTPAFTVTYGGNALTRVSDDFHDPTQNVEVNVAWYRLLNPPTGTNNLVWTMTANVMEAIALVPNRSTASAYSARHSAIVADRLALIPQHL